MSRSVNKVLLIGNLGFDPEELRYTPSGTAVLTLQLATNEDWKDKQTGEKKTHTEWHRIVLYNHLATFAHQNLRKGSRVWVEGRARKRKWEKEGKTESIAEVIAHVLIPLDSRGNSDANWEEQSAPPITSTAKTTTDSSSSQNTTFRDDDEFNDDIPF